MYKNPGRPYEGVGRTKVRQEMWRLLKMLLVLVSLGAIGLVGYAYLADLAPEQQRVSAPVTLDVD